MNAHDLLFSTSPYGTFKDDQALIDFEAEEGNNFRPIWDDFKDRKGMTPQAITSAYFAK